MTLLLLCLLAARADEPLALAEAAPLAVPLAVPRMPSMRVEGTIAMPSLGFTRSRSGEVVVDTAVGRTIVWIHLESFPEFPCACDHPELTCAIRDDGALDLRLADPTRPRPRTDLGRCVVGDHTLQVDLTPAPVPDPVAAGPGRWVVPVDREAPSTRPILVVDRLRRWSVMPAAACVLEPAPRGGGRVVFTGDATDPTWRPCVRSRQGEEIQVRAVPYVPSWELFPPAG